jgi:hypothetical protein
MAIAARRDAVGRVEEPRVVGARDLDSRAVSLARAAPISTSTSSGSTP